MGTKTTVAIVVSSFLHRGKLVLVGLASTILTGLFAFLMSQQPWSSAAAADQIDLAGDYEQIVVQPGDTLWGISARLSGERDQIVILEQILAYNDLDSSALDVGQTLYIPVVE